jgi:hypothetical protein
MPGVTTYGGGAAAPHARPPPLSRLSSSMRSTAFFSGGASAAAAAGSGGGSGSGSGAGAPNGTGGAGARVVPPLARQSSSAGSESAVGERLVSAAGLEQGSLALPPQVLRTASFMQQARTTDLMRQQVNDRPHASAMTSGTKGFIFRSGKEHSNSGFGEDKSGGGGSSKPGGDEGGNQWHNRANQSSKPGVTGDERYAQKMGRGSAVLVATAEADARSALGSVGSGAQNFGGWGAKAIAAAGGKKTPPPPVQPRGGSGGGSRGTSLLATVLNGAKKWSRAAQASIAAKEAGAAL